MHGFRGCSCSGPWILVCQGDMICHGICNKMKHCRMLFHSLLFPKPSRQLQFPPFLGILFHSFWNPEWIHCEGQWLDTLGSSRWGRSEGVTPEQYSSVGKTPFRSGCLWGKLFPWGRWSPSWSAAWDDGPASVGSTMLFLRSGGGWPGG